MANSTYDLIKKAIIDKKQVIADYNGHRREMCPHAIGTKNGRQQALFYQFGGTSSSGIIVPGAKDNWRCILIEKLENVTIKEGQWHSASDHSRPQSCVDNIDVKVNY